LKKEATPTASKFVAKDSKKSEEPLQAAKKEEKK